MSSSPSTLFNLLPAVYRLRDAEIARSRSLLSPEESVELAKLQVLTPPLTAVQQERLDQLETKATRGPLQSLLMVVEEQLAILADNLDQLYDDQFIETCAPWVIPYIGDLIGYQAVNGIASAVASPRAEVAHTISFRRRKGTVLVMEQLARDVTGWGAHAVEFFLRLAYTQYMNHIRPFNHYSPNLRKWEPREYMNSGFDQTAHNIDVRRIANSRGRYNIQNIGIFLWSLSSYSVTHSPLTSVTGNAQSFRLSSLGRDIPLFNLPISQGTDITEPATPANVPGRLSRHVLCRDIQNITTKGLPAVYYGEGLSLSVYSKGSLVNASGIQVCNLSGKDGAWMNLPPANGPIAIDPELGRIGLPPGTDPSSIAVTCHYGFNADMGGGEYPRKATFTAAATQTIARVPGDYPTIHQALTAIGGDGVVEIENSGTYSETSLTIAVKQNGHLELRAADGSRPTLHVSGGISITGGAEGSLNINGLMIDYEPAGGVPTPPALIHVPAAAGNELGTLAFTNTTLVPGWALQPDGTPQPVYAGLPTLLVEQTGLQITVQNSILGGLLVNGQSTATLTSSIIDATDPTAVAYAASIDGGTHRPQAGGALTLDGCTVIGKVYASLLSLVSNSILWAWLSAADQAATPPLWMAPLWSSRRQEGCVRFSYLPAGAIIPKQYECVEMAQGVVQPVFYSLRYGDPTYCKLRAATDDAIRRGADDGGEMGVFHFLLAPLRETDLKIRMGEYLPVGLEFGIFYQD